MVYVKRVLLKLPLLLLASCLAAQTGPVSGPVAGLLYDGANRAVRPVLGVPGASHLGDAVITDADFARLSPDADSAIVLSGSTVTLYRGLGTGKTAVWRLEDTGRIGDASWTADSTAVALYSAESGRLRIWSGFPELQEAEAPDTGSPRSQKSNTRRGAALPSVVELGRIPAELGEITALAAVSDTAALVGIGGRSGAVRFYEKDTSPVSILDTPDPSAMALSADGRDLYVTDRSRNQLLMVPNYREATGATLLAGASSGINQPVALSLKTGALWIANAADPSLLSLNLATRTVETRIPLDFVPTRLQRLGTAETYVLTKAPLRLLRATADPRVFFVPASKLAKAK